MDANKVLMVTWKRHVFTLFLPYFRDEYS